MEHFSKTSRKVKLIKHHNLTVLEIRMCKKAYIMQWCYFCIKHTSKYQFNGISLGKKIFGSSNMLETSKYRKIHTTIKGFYFRYFFMTYY